MKRLAYFLATYLAAGATAWSGPPARGALSRALPAHEREILLDVGSEYGLNPDETRLLLAIRLVENGRAGLEMGVASNFPGHRARRYAHDPEQSLRLQAQWAAGTIRKRYSGDLEAFARVYCPPNWMHWASMVQHWMQRE